MKTFKIRLILALLTVFSTLLGASLKVWDYPYDDVFLTLGLLGVIAFILSMIPKDDSFLDRWV